MVKISFSSNSLRPSRLEFEEFVVVGSVVSSKKVVVTVKKGYFYQEYSGTFERCGMPSQITPKYSTSKIGAHCRFFIVIEYFVC